MNNQYIISGYVAGQKFRPSNWPERLCEAGATLDPRKRIMRYSPHLHPRQCEAYGSSVYVNFAALDAELAGFVREFIASNSMETIMLKPNVVLEVVSEQKAADSKSATPASYETSRDRYPQAA